jgi:hypothetical protein
MSIALVLLICYHLYEFLLMSVDHTLRPLRPVLTDTLPGIVSSWRLEMRYSLIQNKVFKVCDELRCCLALDTS